MPWWAWFVLGTALLAAEVMLATDFYLVFFGLSALVVGLLGVAGVPIPVWAQWLTFAGLAVACLVFYREKLRAWLIDPDAKVSEEITGKVATASDAIASGAEGRVELRGTQWKALNEGPDLAAGERCNVLRKDGLTLFVRKETAN